MSFTNSALLIYFRSILTLFVTVTLYNQCNRSFCWFCFQITFGYRFSERNKNITKIPKVITLNHKEDQAINRNLIPVKMTSKTVDESRVQTYKGT